MKTINFKLNRSSLFMSKLVLITLILMALFSCISCNKNDKLKKKIEESTVDQLTEFLKNKDWQTRILSNMEIEKRLSQGKTSFFPKLYKVMVSTTDLETRLRLELINRNLNHFDNRKYDLPKVIQGLWEMKQNIDKLTKTIQAGAEGNLWKENFDQDVNSIILLSENIPVRAARQSYKPIITDKVYEVTIIYKLWLRNLSNGLFNATHVDYIKSLNTLSLGIGILITYYNFDGDGMPTNWELDNGLDPTKNDEKEDPDKDSRLNIDEFLQNKNPLVKD